jgi:nitroreductase
MNNYIENLNWRYATKKFDTKKKIPDEDLEILLEATLLSPSSYGLQPYHIFVISDPDLRSQLKPASWNQAQITEASHLVVFANKINYGEDLVDSYLENLGKVRNIPMESLKGRGDFMKSKVVGLPREDKSNWTAKQSYLSLGNFLAAAANLHIDACPMEGFDASEYNKILGLEEKGLNASVIVAIGYRSAEDQTQFNKKVRQSKEKLFTHL